MPYDDDEELRKWIKPQIILQFKMRTLDILKLTVLKLQGFFDS